MRPTNQIIASPDSGLGRAAALGRYLVLGLVGKGAMGEVYAAYDPELDRKIAIKLLRGRSDRPAGEHTPVGAAAHEGRLRLLREAKAIAKLSHPNVVTVYDVGTFQDDVFIAMQFAEGHTLRYWIHAQPRSWYDIVKVFVAAGRGLAAAHDKDLIHRDFKPENVMVSADGQVRVMDFGLARAVLDRDGALAPAAPAAPAALLPPHLILAARADSNLDPDSTRAINTMPLGADAINGSSEVFNIQLTQTGAMLGTPAYMSPEQFRGLPVDASADQFSFCVALYEALYGDRPFPGNSILQLMASVTEGTVSAPRAGAKVPARIRKVLLRGLRLKAEDRWPSMQALLSEIEKGQPSRRAPRRRFASGAAAKLAGIWEAPVRGRAADTAAKLEIRDGFLATEKKYAADAFAKVSAILDRYARDWSEMYADICEATHVRGEQSAEILDLRMASLYECLDSLRALSHVFRQPTAEVVENAVSAAHALVRVSRCADVKALRAVVKAPDDPATRASVDRLRPLLAEVRALCRVGRLTDGLAIIVPLTEEVRRTGYGALVAEALFELGNLHVERRDPIAGAIALEEAVWTAELCHHDEVAAKAAAQLVYAIGGGQRRFDAGEIWARHAETILRRMGGHDDLWGWLFNNRGAMRQEQGRLVEAVEDARRAVAAKEKAHGPDSADVGLSLSNVAVYLEALGNTEEAVAYIERGVGALEAGLGPEHPRTAVLLSNYAEILNRLGRFGEAREMARRALAIFERESAPDTAVLAYPLTALGLGYLGEGMADRALPVLERAVAIRDKDEVRASSRAEAHFALARALGHAGRDPSRARDLAQRARAEFASDPPSPPTTRYIAQIEAWLDAGSPPR